MDTGDFNLAKQTEDLWAISAGLSCNIIDDYEILKFGERFIIQFAVGPNLFLMNATQGIQI